MKKRSIIIGMLCCLAAAAFVAGCNEQQSTGDGGLVFEDLGPGNSVSKPSSDSSSSQPDDIPPVEELSALATPHQRVFAKCRAYISAT